MVQHFRGFVLVIMILYVNASNIEDSAEIIYTKKGSIVWDHTGATDNVFINENSRKRFYDQFKYNMECTQYPACVTGWKSIGDGSDDDVLEGYENTIGENEYNYPMTTDSPNEIFVGEMEAFGWNYPYKCQAACKALRETGRGYSNQAVGPINAANLYLTWERVQTPDTKYYEMKWRSYCYCYKGARRVRRIREKGKQFLNENKNYEEKLRWRVKTCGVTRVLGKSDNTPFNWLGLKTVNTDDKSKSIWKKETEKFAEQEASLNG